MKQAVAQSAPDQKKQPLAAAAPQPTEAADPASPPTASQDDDQQDLDTEEDFREQDRLLPIANVGRIMKLAVPPSAKISKEAKESVQECVSEFITFVSSEAADRCHQEKRKTINGEDIIWAMEQLGFDQYANLMKLYLQRYKEVLGELADLNYYR